MLNENDAFDCKTCKWGRHCDKSNPASYDIFEIKVDDYHIKQDTCFLPEVDQDSMNFISQHQHYQSGHLLIHGGISKQPALYLRAMRFLSWLTQKSN